jgi:integrase
MDGAMASNGRAAHQGIYARHRTACTSRLGEGCNCQPAWQAQVWSAVDNKPIRKTFPTLAAARAWRADAQVAIRRGRMRAPSAVTLTDAGDAWVAGARAQTIRNRSGDPYKPSVIRGYEAALRRQILPELGARKLGSINRRDVQALADRWLEEGMDPATVRNYLMPLRVIFRRAVSRGIVDVNPTRGLELPAARGRRTRIADPTEAQALLAALDPPDRALYAVAIYAGLRRGELRALQWEDIDLEAGTIHVHQAWDPKEGPIETKTHAGRRTVPIPATLCSILLAHRLRQGTGGIGYLFTNRAGQPFDPSTVVDRVRKAWQTAGLNPIGLHECRHTYASLLIAAGVNPKAISTYLGHASITITLDRYGHLMPGNQEQAAEQMDGYLARAAAAAISQTQASS